MTPTPLPVVEGITVFLGTFRSLQQEIQQEISMKVLKIKCKKNYHPLTVYKYGRQLPKSAAKISQSPPTLLAVV